MTYDITSEYNGRLLFNHWGLQDKYSTILSTDYKTYILQYKCKQAYMDFYTQEYIDIWTPDGTISDQLLKDLKERVKTKMPNFNIEGTLMPAQQKNCQPVNAWGII